jgi:hypothetical protein
MKPINGFKSEIMSKKPKMLPAGPYVAKIKAVKIDGQEPNQQLVLRVDVCEGEYTDYFMKRYKMEAENSRFEPRYKGDYKLRIPNENSMYPESDLRRFNDAIARIERSNEGYKWDWNEQGLVGKLVGINMQQGDYNGYPFTKIASLAIADDVRKGLVETLAPIAPRGDADDSEHIDKQSGFTAVQDEQLPWF